MKILVTGGASGLGAAITRRMASLPDAMVYFTYSTSSNEASNLEKEFTNTKAIPCNFNEATDIASLLKHIAAWDLDILVNNAYHGAFLKTYFHKIAVSEFLEDFKVNVLPTVKITQAAITCFRKKKQGKIITILTAALVNTPPIGSSVYLANKGYIERLTKVWAIENSKYNISSNSVSPSFMKTALTSETDERIVEQMTESHPLKKLLTVQEVADTVAYLATATAQVNGVDILLNAAMSLK